MSVSALASRALQDWKRPSPGALPYLHAMLEIRQLIDVITAVVDGQSRLRPTIVTYGAEQARDVVRYFLSNASTWRGPVAREVKAELRRLLEAADNVAAVIS